MPHPKRRHSKSRGRKRRTNYKATASTTTSCSNCGAPVLNHRVCPECGFYRGKQVVAAKEVAA